MTNGELVTRQARAESETLVIAPMTTGGFRVYAPTDLSRYYLVTGLPGTAQCTCADFQTHTGDPDWRCEHVLAVSERFFPASGNGTERREYDGEERRAIQEEGQSPRRKRTQAPAGAVMMLKRSVSPDRRIDALSVEFSLPVTDIATPDVTARAEAILALQEAIVRTFMGEPEPRRGSRGNGGAPNGHAPQPASAPDADTFPAQLLSVGGMDGRYGRRLFITVDVNGETTKLFGSRRQLGEALAAAGYAGLAATINEGVSLDLSCRVVTKLSPDGRFINIERVLPPETSRTPGTAKRP